MFFVIPFLSIAQLSSDQNYVYNASYIEPVNIQYVLTSIENDKVENVSYLDAFGKVNQVITISGGGNSQDIVSHIEYDQFGRQTKSYLPYPEDNTNLSFRNNALSETLDFYNSAKFDYTGNPYSEYNYLNDPRNLITEKASPGESWSINSNHTMKYEYLIDELSNPVYRFEVDYNINNLLNPEISFLGQTQNSSEYYIYRVKSENWNGVDKDNTTLDFYDNKGRLKLIRRFNNNIPNDTYYLHDDFGNIVYVLSPKASDQIIVNGVLASNYTEILNELSYQYKYDYKNRLIEKKIPGKEWEYIVYDKLGRPTLTQDGNQRINNQWLFTKYDPLGRVAYTGIYDGVESREAIQNLVNNFTIFNEERTLTPTTIGDVNIYYSKDQSFPFSAITVLTVNYYDDYVDMGNMNLPTTVYDVPLTDNTKGFLTVSKVRVLGTNNPEWVTTFSGFDQKGRIIYNRSLNDYLDTNDITEFKIDFTGKVLESKKYHNKLEQASITTINSYTYDHMGRLISHLQQIDNEPTQLIKLNKYDELGQLIEKKVGGELWENGYADISNVSINPSTGVITKIGTTNWNAGLSTIGKMDGDGGISFTVENHGDNFIVGLNEESTNNGFEEIDYAFHIKMAGSTPKAFIRIENVILPTSEFTRREYEAGDTFAIEREAATLYFKHNDEVVYIYIINGNNPDLYGDASFNTQGAAISDFSFYATTIVKYLQDVDYSYNIRGWLTDINNVGSQVFGLDDDLFHLRINYDVVEGQSANEGVEPLYNGNIAQTIWESKNDDNTKRSYGYKYDNLNRIIGADSRKNTGLNTSDKFKIWDVTYDKNGNIQHLNRNGYIDGNTADEGVKWDDLSYDYESGGNKLINVSDATTNNAKGEGFNDVNIGSINNPDFTYDNDGNLVGDKNKNITDVIYNHLNLPTQITIDDNGVGGTINYKYDASGIKLEKTFRTTGVNPEHIVTQYAGRYIYQKYGTINNKLQFFSQPEGYVIPVANTTKSTEKYDTETGQTSYSAYNYVFQFKDHLGNVRISYSDSDLNGSISTSEIIEENNYYPFGLKQKGYNNNVTGNGNFIAQQYKFGGKQLQEELEIQWYDFGARNYDASIGRWFNIDPLSEYMRNQSTYNYGFNNPIYFTDSEGMIPWPVLEFFNSFSRKEEPDSYFRTPSRPGHNGLDINFSGGGDTDLGAPVVSTHSGIVDRIINIETGNAGGRVVVIQSPDGTLETKYMHLSSIDVIDGQLIQEGDQIGLLGGSAFGRENGRTAHLHYEIHRDYGEGFEAIDPWDNAQNRPIDPQQWIVEGPWPEDYYDRINENQEDYFDSINIPDELYDQLYPDMEEGVLPEREPVEAIENSIESFGIDFPEFNFGGEERGIIFPDRERDQDRDLFDGDSIEMPDDPLNGG